MIAHSGENDGMPMNIQYLNCDKDCADSARTPDCMHPDQFRAMLGLGREKPDFTLKLNRPPLSIPQIIAIFGAMGAFVGLPHAEEFWRCWKAKQRGLTGVDTPECARERYA
jgi:hypothetical protein